MSFSRKKDQRRLTYLRFITSIENQLREKFIERAETDGLTQAAIAEKLGVNRSSIHRRLTGQVNMTSETISDMLWALGCQGELNLIDCSEHNRVNSAVVGDPFASVSRSHSSVPDMPPQSRLPTPLPSLGDPFQNFQNFVAV